MQFYFDHLVHFVNHPEEAVERMRQNGLHSVMGGEHEGWGSYNALCYFDLSYIEFLGLNKPDLARQIKDNDLVRQAADELPSSEGFARIALRTDNIEEAAGYMRKLGLVVTGPFSGSRNRKDGTVVRWSMFFVKEKGAGGPRFPFVIQWGQSDKERRKELQERKIICPHPAGQVALEKIAFVVRDVESVAEKWGRMFHLKRGDVHIEPALHARCMELQLPGGNLMFCSPYGPGIVSEQLESKGEGPFLLRLSGSRKKGTIKLLGSYYQFV